MIDDRTHIAMIGVPIVSHVLPSLAVIGELTARGHRVTYANDPAIAELITGAGAEFVPCTSRLPVQTNDWPDDPIAAMTLFLDDAIRALPQLTDFYGAQPADLYLYDIGAYAGRALAESQDRAVVQLSPTFVSWDGYDDEVASQLRLLPGAGAYHDRFARWLRGCGATTTDVDTFSGPPARSVALIPRAMQPHADLVDDNVVSFVGPCFPADAEDQTWSPPADAERILIISLGSAYTHRPEFYRRCIAAFGDLPGWHVVLQIGKYTAPQELGEIPANIEVHSWIPQRAILEHAHAFVTHAGMGGCSEGLLAGVPMIAVPQAAEQFMNADRLVELGIARRLDTDAATATTLRDALTSLVDDPEVAKRSTQLRIDAQQEGGTRRAVDLIEAALATQGTKPAPSSAQSDLLGP